VAVTQRTKPCLLSGGVAPLDRVIIQASPSFPLTKVVVAAAPVLRWRRRTKDSDSELRPSQAERNSREDNPRATQGAASRAMNVVGQRSAPLLAAPLARCLVSRCCSRALGTGCCRSRLYQVDFPTIQITTQLPGASPTPPGR